jgi:formylglycine-generating enzyme required for sulfatase activity
MSDKSEGRQRLAEIEAAVATLRSMLSAEQGETAIAALLAERQVLLARVNEGGTIAQGAGAVAANQGIAGGRDVVFQGDVVLQMADPFSLKGRANVLAGYLRWVMTETGSLTLSGIDPIGAKQAGREALLSLATLYTGLRTSTPRDRDERAPEMTREREPPLSVLEALDRQPRLVVLGDPGSGKSTFVSFAALCLAGERLGRQDANLERLTAPLPDDDEATSQAWTHGPLIPVRVVLRELAARGLPGSGERGMAKHVWDYICLRLDEEGLGEAAGEIFSALRSNQGLVLFDGLDEVPDAEGRREQILEAVRSFAGSLGDSRVLVTSRPYAYQNQGWRLAEFAETSLAPFNAKQIDYFVGAWYAELAAQGRLLRDAASGQAELLRADIQGSERLLDLAKRPLLLTLMASLHAGQGGNLPERREQLYAKAVEMLLDTWESQRRVYVKKEHVLIQPSLAEWLKVDREKVLQVLEELAFEVHGAQENDAGGQAADLRVGRLIELLLGVSRNAGASAEKLLEFLRDRAGLLVERAEGVCSFPHRTFQEYLAACYLTRRSFPRELARLGRQEPDRWREVVLLAGARARPVPSSVWALAGALCPPRGPEEAESSADDWGTLLAGQVLAESVDLAEMEDWEQLKLESVRGGLVRLMRTDSFPVKERAAAGQALASLEDPRFDPERWDLAKEPDLGFVEIPEGPFQMGSDSNADREAMARELPQHPVILPRYWLSRYPVTVGQYRKFVEESGQVPREPDALEGASNLPVVNVSWDEALAYCAWLGDRLAEEVRNPIRTGAMWSEMKTGRLRVTLPSEAEWEKAARGKDGWIYPWGNEADPNRANFDETGLLGRSAVGCFPGGVSPCGCEELSGNVWEWTRSLWGEDLGQPSFVYPYVADDRREDFAASPRVLRVLRGGAFDYGSWSVRCASRGRDGPDSRDDLIGFRVVLSPFPL